MVKSDIYGYLSGWLASEMESEFQRTRSSGWKTRTLKGLGSKGLKYQSWIEVCLSDLFECVLCKRTPFRVCMGDDAQYLYAYNGRFYELIDIDGLKFLTELVRRTMRILEVGSRYVQMASVRIGKTLLGIITSSDEYTYTPDRRYIAFENGIFDLKTGRLRDFDIRCNPYLVLDIEYMGKDDCWRRGLREYGRQDNPCELWDSKLTGVRNNHLPGIIPNPEVRDVFRQWCGSLLLDPKEYTRESCCYLIGPGANGKSVLARVISRVFGEKYFTNFTPRQLFKDSGKDSNIAKLRGKLANLCDDLTSEDMSGGDFKRFVSGQGFEARVLYTTVPINVAAPPLLCCANEMPEQKDDSVGNERRQLVLHTTTHSFLGEEQDTNLAAKLSVPIARMYIFHWIYEGYRKVMGNEGKIRITEPVAAAIRQVMSSSNNMRRWWGERDYIEIFKPEDKEETRWKPLKSLYEDYSRFCEDEGSRARNRRDISMFLRNKGYKEGRGVRRMPHGMEYCVGKRNYDTVIEKSDEQEDIQQEAVQD